ncbi:MAG: ABC transporter permease [Chthoniobacterales bacterium]|nr:ABC transporter permease [Chthoniobacterales bacterium]
MTLNSIFSSTYKSFILPSFAICWRDILRFLRQRHRISGALFTPLLFWVLLSAGFSISFQDPISKATYAQYYFSGTLALIMLFTAIFSTVTVIEDRREGFLQYALVSQAKTASIVTGKLIGGSILAIFQSLIFCILLPFAQISLSLHNLIPLALALLASSLAMTALGFLTAWQSESTAGFHALMNLILLPLWMLSGALFPITPQSGIVWWIYLANPISYPVAAIRLALQPNPWSYLPHTPSLPLSLFITVTFASSLFFISLLIIKRKKTA